MSLSVEWSEAESRPLATNTGWSQFGQWADTLDAASFREVVHFWEHGFTLRPAAFARQLQLALQQHPPRDPSVHDTADGLLAVAQHARDANYLAVSDGFVADGGEDEWDEEAAGYDPFVSEEVHRRDGEKWQGPSGQWFELRNGHPVHIPAPSQGTGNGTAPATDAQTAEPSAEVKAAAAQFVALSKTPLPPEQKAEYAAHLATVLHRMPTPARNAALSALKGGQVHFHPDSASIKKAAESATGKKEKGEVGGFVAYRPNIYDQVELHLDGAALGHPIASIQAHELWHLTDLHFGQEGTARLTDEPGWQTAWKSEISTSRAATKKGIGRYAETNAKEGFAELGREIHEKGLAAVEAMRPKCIAFLRKKGLVPSAAKPTAQEAAPAAGSYTLADIFDHPIYTAGVDGDGLARAAAESRSIFAPSLFDRLSALREDNLTTRTVIVHRSDGTTYPRQQKVSAGEEPSGGHRDAELHDDDRRDIAAGVETALTALPDKLPEGVIAKAKDIALTAAAKVYLWSVQFANSPWMGRVGEVLEAIFDVPSDMSRLGYNPVTTSGTASPQVFDPVKSGLANTLGVGVSGHIVASIASKVLVKAGYWVAKKLSGQASESAEGLDEAITLWADLISQLFAHLAAEFGGSAPDAATVAAHIRDLVKGQL